MKINDVQIEIEKGKEEKKKIKISQQRKKRQHARGIRILQAHKERGGSVTPRRNNRITESAPKESREAKIKSKKAVQESNGKRQDERTKTNEKEQGTGHGERQKKEREKKRKYIYIYVTLWQKVN